jgi:hypothetical protein
MFSVQLKHLTPSNLSCVFQKFKQVIENEKQQNHWINN